MMAEGSTGGATPSVPAATAEPRSIKNTTPGGEALSLGSGESAAAAAVTAGGTGNNGEGGGGVGAGGAERAAKGQVALINVEGMTCAICVGIVTNLLARFVCLFVALCAAALAIRAFFADVDQTTA